jgi:hypothetical protein
VTASSGFRLKAAVVLVVVLLIAAFVSMVAVVAPGRGESHPRLTCMNNLSQLGQVYVVEAMKDFERAQRLSGTALWLSYRKGRTQIKPGYERVLLCPDDPLVDAPDTAAKQAAYDGVDLSRAPRSLCSYAVRDFERFPIDPKSPEKQVIAACIHHKRGAIVVYDAGDATRLSLEELGLASDDEKTVGPASKSPVLRVVRYGDGSVR